ncbi:nuclear transport factor 2 family protein [Sphingomonas sp. ASV193]|uniref:YybH family protein n=1 Tax=Sphingomonas sp. ASV193 TaxID=3144405 RepID=UPI0032E8FCB3
MRIQAALAIMLLAGACQNAGPSGASPVTDAEARQVAEQAEASFTGGNVDAIMSHYADGATMIDGSDPTPTTDRKVQTGWAKTFASMKPADYRVTNRQINIVGPDAFVSSGIESFTVQAGNARPRVSARFTDVFHRGNDKQWKIVAEHVSMPPTPTGAPQ